MVDRVRGRDISTNHLFVRNSNGQQEHCSCPSCMQIGRFVQLMPRMIEMFSALEENGSLTKPNTLQYYSVKQFAKLVDRSIETVRNWCITSGSMAEKCDTGMVMPGIGKFQQLN